MAATVAQAIRHGAAKLAGVADNPRLEARLLLAHTLGVTQTELIRESHRTLDPSAFDSLIRRRAAHEPIALIVGHREFWSMEFQVSPATLIPRADSETLIEAALAAFADRVAPERILDLGTGTGCLLLALLKEFPTAFGIGIDLAADAAALAKDNAEQLHMADRCALVCGSWLDPLSGRFDLIVCNPPYIPAAEIASLMPEVALHEPRQALDGGADGYQAYQAIIRRLPRHLKPEGVAILELGAGQATHVAGIAHEAQLGSSLRLDLSGIPRAIILTQ